MSRSVSRIEKEPIATRRTSRQRARLEIPSEKIAMRAYERWVERGRVAGDDQRDWFEAEAELREELD